MCVMCVNPPKQNKTKKNKKENIYNICEMHLFIFNFINL